MDILIWTPSCSKNGCSRFKKTTTYIIGDDIEGDASALMVLTNI